MLAAYLAGRYVPTEQIGGLPIRGIVPGAAALMLLVGVLAALGLPEAASASIPLKRCEARGRTDYSNRTSFTRYFAPRFVSQIASPSTATSKRSTPRGVMTLLFLATIGVTVSREP